MKKHINQLAKQKSFRQLVKYGLVGLVGLVIDIGIYYLLVDKYTVSYPFSPVICTSLLGGYMSVTMFDIIVSSIISSTLAIINNFILNSYFTFKVTDNKLRRFASFAGIATIGMVISTGLLTLFIGIMGINEMLAKALAVLIVAMIQFVINKFFTFKQK